MTSRSLSAVLVVMTACLLMPFGYSATASAQTQTIWYVDGDQYDWSGCLPCHWCGDGSQAAPFPMIRQALNAASPGDIISIAPGDYEPFVIPAKQDLTIIGQSGFTPEEVVRILPWNHSGGYVSQDECDNWIDFPAVHAQVHCYQFHWTEHTNWIGIVAIEGVRTTIKGITIEPAPQPGPFESSDYYWVSQCDDRLIPNPSSPLGEPEEDRQTMGILIGQKNNDSRTEVTLIDCQFRDLEGSAIVSRGFDTSYDANQPDADKMPRVFVEECQFIGNSGSNGWNLLHANLAMYPYADPPNSTLHWNGLQGGGGAIVLYQSVARFTNCEFFDNAVNQQYFYLQWNWELHPRTIDTVPGGGAIFAQSCNIQIESCDFDGNEAYTGWHDQGDAGSPAYNTGFLSSGGAVRIYDPKYPSHIKASTFSNNGSLKGGAIAVESLQTNNFPPAPRPHSVHMVNANLDDECFCYMADLNTGDLVEYYAGLLGGQVAGNGPLGDVHNTCFDFTPALCDPDYGAEGNGSGACCILRIADQASFCFVGTEELCDMLGEHDEISTEFNFGSSCHDPEESPCSVVTEIRNFVIDGCTFVENKIDCENVFDLALAPLKLVDLDSAWDIPHYHDEWAVGGAAIWHFDRESNDERLYITNCHFQDNLASSVAWAWTNHVDVAIADFPIAWLRWGMLAPKGGAIMIANHRQNDFEAALNVIENCSFVGNKARGPGGAICMHGPHAPRDHADPDGDTSFYYSARLAVRDSFFRRNKQLVGVQVSGVGYRPWFFDLERHTWPHEDYGNAIYAASNQMDDWPNQATYPYTGAAISIEECHFQDNIYYYQPDASADWQRNDRHVFLDTSGTGSIFGGAPTSNDSAGWSQVYQSSFCTTDHQDFAMGDPYEQASDSQVPSVHADNCFNGYPWGPDVGGVDCAESCDEDCNDDGEEDSDSILEYGWLDLNNDMQLDECIEAGAADCNQDGVDDLVAIGRGPQSYSDDFEGGTGTSWGHLDADFFHHGWQLLIDEEATADGEVDWTRDEWMSQTKNCHGYPLACGYRPGTKLVWIADGENWDESWGGPAHPPFGGPVTMTDYSVQLGLWNTDNDWFGVVFRMASPDTYYLFASSNDPEYGSAPFTRLFKSVNGEMEVIWSTTAPWLHYCPDCLHSDPRDLEITVQGSQITITTHLGSMTVTDDGSVLPYSDEFGHIPYGTVGFYAGGSDGAHFDDFVLEDLRDPNHFTDCNLNGNLDACDIASGSDCDGNGLVDSCEWEADPDLNCNGSNLLDSCEIAAGFDTDCNGNGLLDMGCEFWSDPDLYDCDGDGEFDHCQINVNATYFDCNSNLILDSCEIAADPSLDCNLNGVLDSCDDWSESEDCNQNGIPDECDAIAGDLYDNDGNGTWDQCESSYIWTFGPGSGGTIQGMIDQMLPGQTLQLEAGTYVIEQALSFDGDVTIRGSVDVDGLPISELVGDGETRLMNFWQCSREMVMEDLLLTQGHSYQGGAVDITKDAAPTFRNCTFRANEASSGGAIAVSSGAEPPAIFIDCRFDQNEAVDGNGGAVYANGSHGSWSGPLNLLQFERCTFTDNVANSPSGKDFFGNGGAIATEGELSLIDCVLTGNKALWNGSGIFIDNFSETQHVELLGTRICENLAIDIGQEVDQLGEGYGVNNPSPWVYLETDGVDENCVSEICDSDGDSVYECQDQCPGEDDSLDLDEDGIIDCLDDDVDGDGHDDVVDNCPLLSNPDQADCDEDGIGDVCELADGTQVDENGDGVPDDCEAADCPPDFSGADGVPDGAVGIEDLLHVIAEWGTPGGDCDGDADTDIEDLLTLIGWWGLCP